VSHYHFVCLLTLAVANGAIVQNYGNLPLVFEPNRGQTSPQTRFLARAAGYDVFVTNEGAVLRVGSASVRMRLAGSRRTAKPEAVVPLTSYSNYILGNDPSRWLRAVPQFAKVHVAGILPGVDLTYYGDRRNLEYDLDVAPGADTRSLALKFDGAQGLSLDEEGNLLIHTASGDVTQHKPVASQGPKRVKADYALLQNNGVAIRLGAYDHNKALKIDPVLSYSTYLSGSYFDAAFGIAVDSSGYAYVTGTTGSVDFPVTSGTLKVPGDVFVTKLSRDGTALVYSTYIGGNNDDHGLGIAIDGSGNAYVTGYTQSTDFPVLPVGSSSYDGGGQDVIIFKLDATGTLAYSGYLGGGPLTSGNGIAVDANGNAYVVGVTSATIQTTAGSIRPTRPSRINYPYDYGWAFAIKVNSAGAVAYGTYLAGLSFGDTVANAVTVDASGNAYITGSTDQTDYPVTIGAFGRTFAGGFDSFVSKLDPTGSTLLFSTYLGGSDTDIATAVTIDSLGNTYVTGRTYSSDFPTTPGAYTTVLSSTSTAAGFVSKLNSSASALTFSTYLAGTTSPNGIVVDQNGNVTVAGSTTSGGFPATPGALRQNLEVVSGMPENSLGLQDGFIARLNPAGSSLTYATYFGSSSWDTIAGIAGDTAGAVYVAGATQSHVFPTTATALQVSSKKFLDDTFDQSAFVSKIDLASPTICNVVLSNNSVSLPGQGGPGSFNFTVANGCPWEIITDPFITINGAVHGVGSGTVNYTVANNQSIASGLTGAIVVTGGTLLAGTNVFTVVQAAGSCGDPAFDTGGVGFNFVGGSTNLAIALPSACVWNLVNTAPWLTITSGGTESGTGTLLLNAAPNSFGQRQGTITVAGQSLPVTQNAGSCTVTLTGAGAAFGPGGGSGGMSFITSGASCAWTAYSSAPWIQISSNGSSGQGNGTAPFTVLANPGSLPRTGQLSIGDKMYTVTQTPRIMNVGIFRSGFFWILDVDGNQLFNNPPDLAFAFGGNPGDIPITGDWNGDGRTKVGVYRPHSGLFVLDYDGDGQFTSADKVYNLGVGTDPTDIPVIGDWNGDGRSKIGIYRQGFEWLLDYNGDGAYQGPPVDRAYFFGGIPGDVPVVGDWTGTGTSKIGLVRLGFYWVLDANGNGTFDGTGAGQDLAFPFGGISGDVPVVGDWNGDGTSKVGVFRLGFFWVLDANGNRQFDGTGAGGDLAFAFGGIQGDKPVTGKW
jgi:Beta-propeller repeat/Viral BACON domain